MATKPKGKATATIPTFDQTLAKAVDKRLIKTKIVLEDPDFLPKYETPGAACCDLYANLPKDIHGERKLAITPGSVLRISVGFKMQLPEGWEAQIRARSGLASRGLVVANGPGTIDDDYRDDLNVIIANIGRHIIHIEHKQRIAQMALKPVYEFHFDVVDKLDPVEGENARKGGFGSTGDK